MARKEKTNYAEERRQLLSGPPGRLYLLWGEEEYLRDSYYSELMRLVFPDGDSGMSHRRLDGQAAAEAVRDAVLTLPFFTERTLVELRGFNPNKCPKGEAERMLAVLSDIPEYCTVAILPEAGFEPDGRLSIIKTIKKHGLAVEFTPPDARQLLTWISRRVEAGGKTIDRRAAEHLVFLCSPLMSRLRPEIDKLVSYAQGGEIKIREIDRVVERVPETRVFELTDRLAERNYDGAAACLAELLYMREEPIALLAMIGTQFRRLYAARLALDAGLGDEFLRETTGVKYDFLIKKLKASARGFSLPGLGEAVLKCAECDYLLKSSGQDGKVLITTLILGMAVRA